MPFPSDPARGAPLPAYRVLLAEADAWFARAADAMRDEVRCRAGCDACCRGLFDVSALDALAVADGVRDADPATRAELEQAARGTLARVRAAAPGWGAPYRVGDLGSDAFDALCDALADEPCAALRADGTCRIYARRPLVCRLHGLPMWDPAERAYVGGACDLNAVPPEAARVTPELHFAHAPFEERELELLAAVAGREAGADPEASGTIVAAAVLAALVPTPPRRAFAARAVRE